MRLIDADALIEKAWDADTRVGYVQVVDVGDIKDAPTIEPERQKGKWIWITGDVYKCSECETETHVDECFGEPIYNYCPYCNAFMDGYER